VRNNEFWLSDATYINDKEEIEHGRTLVLRCLEEALAWDGHPEARDMIAETLSIFESKGDPKVYVLCSSLEEDDLSQWRGYGQGGAPVAIEIEHGPLMFGYVSDGRLDQVIYELEDQKWRFGAVIRAHWKRFSEDTISPRAHPKGGDRKTTEERNSCADILYYRLWNYIVTCKNPAFRSEREVRFTYTAHDYSDSRVGFYPEHPKPLFRESGGRVIPYLSSKNLHHTNMGVVRAAPRLPIKSIRIGPAEDSVIVARGIRELLDAHGHEMAKITSTLVPFRSR
jgi:hypothetical protein